MIYGYCRISSDSQNLDLQKQALSKSDVDEIVEEVFTGATLNRPQLDALLNKVKSGDFIVVYKLDRLSRGGLIPTLELINDLSLRGVFVICLSEGISTDNNNPMSRAFLQLLAVFAELERSIIKERVYAGIEAAKKRGAYKGRKRLITRFVFNSMLAFMDEGHSVKETCKEFSISRTAFYEAKKLFISTNSLEKK